MRSKFKQIIIQALYGAISLLVTLGLPRQRSYAMLPEKAQAWLRSRQLSAEITVVSAPFPTLHFPKAKSSEIYKIYFWEGIGAYEPETTEFIRRAANDYAWFLDIGAHHGHYAIVFALSNPRGTVKAFEPVPENADILKANLARNGLRNVSVYQAAVTGADGKCELFLPERGMSATPSIGSLKNRFADDGSFAGYGWRTIEVRSISAESASSNIPEGRGLIKLDTEGTEDMIIQALAPFLGRRQPDLIFEVLHPPETDQKKIREILTSCGYELRLLAPGTPRIPSLEAIEPEDLPHRKEASNVAWGEVLATPSHRTHD